MIVRKKDSANLSCIRNKLFPQSRKSPIPHDCTTRKGPHHGVSIFVPFAGDKRPYAHIIAETLRTTQDRKGRACPNQSMIAKLPLSDAGS